MNKRWIGFIFMIGLGIASGLIYGWVLQPRQAKDAALDTLRQDYKTDYVLMVAEIFRAEQSTQNAFDRLALIGNDPFVSIENAIRFSERLGYHPGDVEQMRKLGQALEIEAIP